MPGATSVTARAALAVADVAMVAAAGRVVPTTTAAMADKAAMASHAMPMPVRAMAGAHRPNRVTCVARCSTRLVMMRAGRAIAARRGRKASVARHHKVIGGLHRMVIAVRLVNIGANIARHVRKANIVRPVRKAIAVRRAPMVTVVRPVRKGIVAPAVLLTVAVIRAAMAAAPRSGAHRAKF